MFPQGCGGARSGRDKGVDILQSSRGHCRVTKAGEEEEKMPHPEQSGKASLIGMLTFQPTFLETVLESSDFLYNVK